MIRIRPHPLLPFAAVCALTLPAAPGFTAPPPAESVIRIEVAPGLRFEPARFWVVPGAKVTVAFHNPDEMIHNFVLTSPGGRLAVVTAALAMGADGPARNFVPASDQVLWHSPALSPGQSATVTFTAPQAEGVYPYVCTFPGHGFVMYGAMYVAAKPPALPPLEKDPNLPPPAAPIEDFSDHSRGLLDHPEVCRTFLPDCGPGAIAVGLPGGHSFCYDAAACRLRYAWQGGFVDNLEQWAGKGDSWSKVVGHIYYRAPDFPPLRLGDPRRLPAAKWLGYRLIDGYPQFHYTLDGVEVGETARLSPDGNLELSYEIAAAAPVYYVTDPARGAAFRSSAGNWTGGVLSLTAGEARHFVLTLRERPGVEPIGYWSMNDAFWPSARMPLPGVLGRAFTPGGLAAVHHLLATGITTKDLQAGGTVLAWVKLDEGRRPGGPPPAPPGRQPIFSAGTGPTAFVIAAPEGDHDWHLAAATFAPGGSGWFVDGVRRGEAPAPLPANEEWVIGSVGDQAFLNGLIDEVRIYNRPLSPTEIQEIYRRERPKSPPVRPPADSP